MTELETLSRAVRGGRVAHTTFLEPEEASLLSSKLRESGANVHASGGYTGAKRRVVTAFPEHIPSADTPLCALYVANLQDEAELTAALRSEGIEKDLIGDILSHQEGLSVVLLPDAKAKGLGLTHVGGRPVSVQEVSLERLARGKERTQQIIVPSLRVDVLGAKAFRVSRAYFAKGIAGGRVSVNGALASKSSTATLGDEIYAEGLGRFTIKDLQGETRKGNIKVFVYVEQG